MRNGCDDRKFFPPHAAKQIVIAQIASNGAGKGQQRRIASGVPKAVIDRFKVVDIQHHDADPLALLADQPRSALHKSAAGQYMGQSIMIRHVLKPLQQRIASKIHTGHGNRSQRQ
ncbi:hypothetical protein D3C75_965570 [compost metagenome]